MGVDRLSAPVAIGPAAAQNDDIAVGCDPSRAIHPVRAGLVLGRSAAEPPSSPAVFACPAVQVTLPEAVAGLVEDQGKDCAVVQDLEVGPRADSLDGSARGDAG